MKSTMRKLLLSALAASFILTGCNKASEVDGTDDPAVNDTVASESEEPSETEAEGDVIIPLYKPEYEDEIRAISPADLAYFDQMGVYRLLYAVPDKSLLRDLCQSKLDPLLQYDEEHHANYVDTLEMYLECGGSIQAMASRMYIHRNTILYRMNNIKQLLGCDLETTEEKLPYIIACMIRHMKL